jgi:hypothetical protein
VDTDLEMLQRINNRQYLDGCGFGYSKTRVPGIVVFGCEEYTLVDYRGSNDSLWGTIKIVRSLNVGSLVWVYICCSENNSNTDCPLNSRVIGIESMESND